MMDDFVHALTELRISMFFGHELRADADIARAPALATVVGAVNTTRRHRNQHSARIVGIEHDRVQAKPAATRLPLRLVLVIEQPLVGLPARSSISRLEE